MPKVQKQNRFVKKGGSGGKGNDGSQHRHNPLHVDIENSKQFIHPVKEKDQDNDFTLDDLDDDEPTVIPNKLSKKLLSMAEKQKKQRYEQKNENTDSSDDEFDEFGKDDHFESSNDVKLEDGYLFIDEDEKDDEKIYQKNRDETKSLADIILEELRNKKFQNNQQEKEEVQLEEERSPLPEKVQEVYKSIGVFLSRYRSGKMPKAFKILPKLNRWDEILCITEPEKWTPNAMYQATKLFVSNLNTKQVQRFFSLVLLQNVREEIHNKKKCHYHHYMALKKALFKPAAFLKGIFLPLAIEGTCSVKERVIFGSIVKKVSIPVLHSAAALIRLCLISPDEWNPAVSHFIAIILDKKYSLPTRALNVCVNHFFSFTRWEKVNLLPVVWHTALLILVQRYKFQFTVEERRKIRDTLRVAFHEKIGPEIRRELASPNQTAELERQHELLQKDLDMDM